MNTIYGLALLALGIAMIFFGKPRAGMDHAPFLKFWMVGQAYVMAAMIALVVGIVFLIGM